MKKIRVISASFGKDKKELDIDAPLFYKDYVIDVVLYNDQNTKSRVNSLHPRMKSKIPKMMDWLDNPDYDYYIWLDSKFIVLEGFIENMLRYEGKADLFLFNHPERTSIKTEFEHINNKMEKGNTSLIDKYGGELMKEQVELYLSDENFIDDHLFSMGCFMFSKAVVKNKDFNLMTDWLLHSFLYSTQDQLSFPYLLNKWKVKYVIYPENIMNSNFLMHYYRKIRR